MRLRLCVGGLLSFDCLGWPFEAVPPGGGTKLIREITMAVSGAAGTAAIVGAKLGLKTLAVGGYGRDMMGDWALARLEALGADTSGLQRFADVPTSTAIIITRQTAPAPHCGLSRAPRGPSRWRPIALMR